MVRLNQLLPDEDFPVYEFRGVNMSCASVIDALGSVKRLTLHAGEVLFDDDIDDMTRPRFNPDFPLASIRARELGSEMNG